MQTEEDLLDIRNIKRKGIEEIKDILAETGYKLAELVDKQE